MVLSIVITPHVADDADPTMPLIYDLDDPQATVKYPTVQDFISSLSDMEHTVQSHLSARQKVPSGGIIAQLTLWDHSLMHSLLHESIPGRCKMKSLSYVMQLK